jgi:hypothetical protein
VWCLTGSGGSPAGILSDLMEQVYPDAKPVCTLLADLTEPPVGGSCHLLACGSFV